MPLPLPRDRPRSVVLASSMLVALAAGAAGAAEAPDRARRPNVVFFLIDDLGWADVGCNGNTFFDTPNIDRLARRGMRFTQGYAACPVCSPTRASIMAGKYPARLRLTDWIPGRGVRPEQKLKEPDWRPYLPREEVTLAEALAPAGYDCASIGKWHLGKGPYAPTEQGFALNVAGNDRGSPPGYFFPYARPNAPEFALPDLREGGREGEYLTDRLTDEALEFIESHRDRPFFLYIPHFAVHTPIQPRPDLLAKYEAHALADVGGPPRNPHYAAMVESVDESVGRVLAKLRDLRIDDRTIVIFTSDNGGLATKEGPHTPSTSNAPLRAGKGYLYEGGLRVPWIVRWPGVVEEGAVCETPVCSIDFYPTILAMAGAAGDPNHALDGESLVPLLRRAGAPRRDALYWHYPHYSNQGGAPGGAVRLGDLKFIEFYEDDHAELYDLKADPSETTDLAADRPGVVAELRARLHAWRRNVDAQMPTRKAADKQP